MSGPLSLLNLSCRKCGRTNPWVYFALVAVDGAGTCICMDCAEARGWLDSDGNLKPGVAMTSFEIRDDPDDLPIPCATLAEAERRGRRRAAWIGSPMLIYEIDSRGGERFVGVC